MTSSVIARHPLALLIVSICAMTVGAAAQDLGTEAQRQSGRALYARYCSQCHGDTGNGEGHATARVHPRPRNFTTGKFKVRSTPTGALPTHQDLVNIIRRGMPYTSMPAWPTLSNRELSDLAYYIATFSPDFSNPEYVPQPVPLPSAPRATDESAELGKQLYVDSGCVRCHGTLGRGDGSSAPTLEDDWGHPIRPADLTQSWTFRGGSSREDIFRTLSTGFNGTPMPSYLDALTPEQRWALTDYIVSLSGSNGPGYTNLVVARRAQEPIDLAKGAASFASAPTARFPIVGQIMEPGRSFHPPATSVVVQAIYDAESIAVLVRWHDMSAQQTGHNGPSLPVPSEEEEQAAGAAAADPGETESVFGEEEVATPAEESGESLWGDAAAEPAVEESEFSDAVAIQIPSEVPTGARKPYFILGDAQNPVDLWFFDLALPAPRQFAGRGSADIAPADTGDLEGTASYDQGEWSVIFKRPLQPQSGGALTPGEFMPVAFSVWDGFSRERGNRRGLTTWYSLYLEPDVVQSSVGPMVRTALLILVLELIVIGMVRSRYGAGRGGEIGRDQKRQAATSA